MMTSCCFVVHCERPACSPLLECLHSLPPRYMRRREQPIQFVSLPVEILAQIFTHLDFPSVHAVKLTCRICHSVIKTRQFWYNRINNLVNTRYVCSPEDTLDDYTVDELEQWTLRRARALSVLVESKQPHFRKRVLDLRPEGLSGLDPELFKLLPGGRWLLICDLSAAVHFLDLDCPNPTPRLLFDPKEIDDEIREPTFVAFNIWIDRGAPRLSFWLALLIYTEDVMRTYTSRVDLVGHGVDATLLASNIAILRNFNLDMWSVGFALNDRYLVQIWIMSQKARIGVYDHRQALGCPDYPMNSNSDDCADVVNPGLMEFIGNDMLAIQSFRSGSLSIYEVGPSTSLKLLHRIGMRSDPCSTPRWTPKATVITMMSRKDKREIQGLVIPHDSACPPTIVVLGRFNEKKKFYRYTLGTWVLVAKEELHEVFRHDWDLNSPTNPSPTLTYHFQEDFSTNFLTFDEDTGRFLGYPCRWHLVIYDII